MSSKIDTKAQKSYPSSKQNLYTSREFMNNVWEVYYVDRKFVRVFSCAYYRVFPRPRCCKENIFDSSSKLTVGTLSYSFEHQLSASKSPVKIDLDVL